MLRKLRFRARSFNYRFEAQLDTQKGHRVDEARQRLTAARASLATLVEQYPDPAQQNDDLAGINCDIAGQVETGQVREASAHLPEREPAGARGILMETPSLTPFRSRRCGAALSPTLPEFLAPRSLAAVRELAQLIARAEWAPESYRDIEGNYSVAKIELAIMQGAVVGLGPIAAVQSIMRDGNASLLFALQGARTATAM